MLKNSWYYFGIFLVLSIVFSVIQYVLIKYINYLIFLLALLIIIVIDIIFKQKIKRNKEYFSKKYFFILLIIYIFIILLNYYKYPIFPRYESGDFKVHVLNALKFIRGEYQSLKGLSNPAIDMLLAAWFSLGLSDPISSSRLFMVFISILTFWFTYEISIKLNNNDFRTGLIVSLIFIFFNPFWYLTIYTTGLYSNLLGITMSLFALLYIINRYNLLTFKDYLMLFLTGLILLLSHSSTVIVFLSLWSSCIYLYFIERKSYLLKPALILSLPLIVILLIFPNLIYRLPGALQGQFGAIFSADFIAQTLEKFSPFLAFLYVFGGITIVILCILTIILSLYLFMKRKLELNSIFFFWLIFSWFGSLISINVWRFALIALTSICILSGTLYNLVLYPIYHKIKNSVKRKKLFNYTFIILLIIALIGDSYMPGYFIESLYYINEVRVKQFGVYEAMIWLRNNTPVNASIASIGRWEFMFAPIIANRSFLRDSLALPNATYQLLIAHKPSYVAVWNLLHENGVYYVSLYKESGLFKEVWHNDVVTIFIPIYENSTGSS